MKQIFSLNQIIKTAAIEISRKRPDAICISLHPGTVRSSLTEKYVDKYPHFLPTESAVKILKVINSLDYKANGGFFDYAGKIMQGLYYVRRVNELS